MDVEVKVCVNLSALHDEIAGSSFHMPVRFALFGRKPAGEQGYNMEDLSIEYCCLSAIKPYAGNPRSHPKKQVAQIAASIRKFGFVNPLLVDECGSIIAGHGRYLAAQSMNLASVPVVRLKGLSEAQKKALRISDNRIALESGWSVDLLKAEIQSISELEVEFDLEVTGFSTGELDVILSPSKVVDDTEDVIPPVPRTALSRPGDIWRLGPHRLGCGDCGDETFLQRVVGGQVVDAAFLDPPYNVKIDGNVSGRGGHREFIMASGEMSDAQFTTFLTDRLSACAKVSKSGAVHFVCMDHRHIEHLTTAGAQAYGERLNICVWNKSNAGMGSLYRSRHEFIAVFKVGKGPVFNAAELGRHDRTAATSGITPRPTAPRGIAGASWRSIPPSSLTAWSPTPSRT